MPALASPRKAPFSHSLAASGGVAVVAVIDVRNHSRDGSRIRVFLKDAYTLISTNTRCYKQKMKACTKSKTFGGVCSIIMNNSYWMNSFHIIFPSCNVFFTIMVIETTLFDEVSSIHNYFITSKPSP